MKKISIILILFTTFSFIFTNYITDYLKNKDPLMQKIKTTNYKYSISYKNAKITDNTIKSGQYGKKIDLDKSYNKMKKYGTYNETLTTIKTIKPVISIEDNYDKYLVGTNTKKRELSLVFIGNDITKVINILNNYHVEGTFFIDGKDIDNNISSFNNNHEIEILNYNKSYNKHLFKTSINYLESITNKKSKYCYTSEKDKKLLNLCSKLKLHTIKPNMQIDKNLYYEVKRNLPNAEIIGIIINKYTVYELPTTIKYIKNKGYTLKTLDKLLSENR